MNVCKREWTMFGPDKDLGRVGVLLRTSTDEQAQRETIETQRERAKNWLSLRRIDDERVSWYVDDAVSGAIPLHQRPAGSRLVEDIAARLIDTVAVYKL